jgi:hypothetical protein
MRSEFHAATFRPFHRTDVQRLAVLVVGDGVGFQIGQQGLITGAGNDGARQNEYCSGGISKSSGTLE